MKRFLIKVAFEVEAEDDSEQTATKHVDYFINGQEFWPVGVVPLYVHGCGEILEGEAHGDEDEDG
jgi:hypothetical protein